MLPAAFIFIAFIGIPVASLPQDQCADVAACRAAALDAAARGEFENFHDLAWRAVQKGRPNDPDLMFLLARAQSLSGRPGDALVMLRRLAERGAMPDVRTDDEFRRVRALPGWPELEAMLTSSPPQVLRPSESRESQIQPKTAGLPNPAAVAMTLGTPAKPENATVPPPPRAPRIDAAWANDELRVNGASLATIGLAHDSVSRRFIVGDPAANKLVVVDEVFNRVNDLIGAVSGGFFGLRALEIDSRRGDLWVANSGGDRRASVHKLQLVSGRVLFELPLPTEFRDASFEDLAVAPSGAVLIVDSRGRRLLRVPPGARVFERVAEDASLETARSIAPVDDHVVYVAHEKGLSRADLSGGDVATVQVARGTHVDGSALQGLRRIRWHRGTLLGVQADQKGVCRIVRIALNRPGTRVTKVEVLDENAAMPDPTAAAIDDGVLFYLTQEAGASIVRRIALNQGG